jgi:pimeloyl-ACP methyl ester carboxylesterase
MQLSGGSLQVLDTPSKTERPDRGIPVVLLHCYTCSLRWWDRVAPLLADRHRVVRFDLLGHGGSDKPAEGYDVDRQADLVAEALGQLGIEGALVVGHSLGGSVATALAQRHSELVDRVGLLGVPPDESFADLGLLASLARAPVLGEALWRITPRFMLRSGTSVAFADGYDTSTGFDDSDQPVDDLRAMTYSAFNKWHDAFDNWNETLGLNRRLAGANVPALILLGTEDEAIDVDGAEPVFRETVPAGRVRLMDGVGHSPNVEAPEETAALLASFAKEAEVR